MKLRRLAEVEKGKLFHHLILFAENPLRESEKRWTKRRTFYSPLFGVQTKCNLLCRITANITILDNNVKPFLSIFLAELFATDFYYYAEGKYFLFIMWQYFLHSGCMCFKSFSCAYSAFKTFHLHSWTFTLTGFCRATAVH